MIYLDNNATTQMDGEVFEAMRPYLTNLVGNPSSRHSAGRGARQAIDRSKQKIAKALNADVDQIIFTSGATESNNIVLRGSQATTVLVSAAEHPSVLEPAKQLERRGVTVIDMALTADGAICVPETLPPGPTMLAMQLANSETGCIQDVAATARLLSPLVRVHCDATQAVGRIAVDFDSLAVSTMALSGHKIHGPAGIGLLIVRNVEALKPIVHGGHQQRDLRPGTEAVASIVGLAQAIEIAVRDLTENARKIQMLRDLFEELLNSRIADAVVNRSPCRLPNTSNVSFLGLKAETLLIALDLAGICSSAGTACASGSLEPSPVLQAMGLDGSRLHGALRFSLSKFTTEEEIHQAVSHLVRVCEQIRKSRVTVEL